MSSLSPAVTKALAAVEADPQHAARWEDLLYHLGQEANPSGVWATLPLMAQYGINRAETFINACAQLAEDGVDLSGLHPLTADPFSTALATVAGCCRGRQAYLKHYDLDAACAAYNRAVQGIPFAALAAKSATLGSDVEQAVLLEFFWTRGLSPLFAVHPRAYSAVPPPEEAPLPWPELPVAGDFMLMASADDHYCRIYGERLLNSLARHCPSTSCLLHIMNPTAEGEQMRREWQQRYPFVVFVSETVPSDVPYYAARRFMLVNAVRQHYRRDLLLVDMDGYMEAGMPGLLAQVRDRPLALIFRTPDPVRAGQPNVLYDAFIDARCLYIAASSTLADHFFTRTHAYLHHILADEAMFWCWDESALCHAWCCLDPADRAGVTDMTALDPMVLSHGVTTGNLHQKTQGTTMTSDQPFAQRILARILGRLFDPAVTPQPFQMLLRAGYGPPIVDKKSR